MKPKTYIIWLGMALALFSFCKKVERANPTQELIQEANDCVHQLYEAAELLEVHGIIPSGVGNTAQDVSEYEFIYGLSEQTVILNWNNGAFSEPELIDNIWLGSFPLPLPLGLSLAEAIEKMRLAGCALSFSAVTIREPITSIIYTEAFYIFTIPGQHFIFVGANSGTVFESN